LKGCREISSSISLNEEKKEKRKKNPHRWERKILISQWNCISGTLHLDVKKMRLDVARGWNIGMGLQPAWMWISSVIAVINTALLTD
jgi:hypothetical protein